MEFLQINGWNTGNQKQTTSIRQVNKEKVTRPAEFPFKETENAVFKAPVGLAIWFAF
jgi:hypothetical protein